MFFTYFYVAITFNPDEVADNMKKYGGFIPGIRPGRADRRLSRSRAVADHRCPVRCSSASSACSRWSLLNLTKNQQFPFAGTSVLIMVGVGLETVKQIESQLQQRHYEGFLR